LQFCDIAKINVKDTEITILSIEDRDYISLTDMANAKEVKVELPI
jgi:hypothetical protein